MGGGPSWLAWIFAGVTLATAVYCVARLLAAWRQHRPTDRHVDGIHVLMGVAMAGMLVPRLRVFWIGGWEVVFGVGAVWFAGLALREHRGRPATGGRPGHHLQHVLACGAMLYMLLAVTGTAGTAAGTAGAMDGMGGGPGGTAHFRTLALLLAFALFGYVVWNADRLSSLPPVAALAARVVPVPVLAGSPTGASDHSMSEDAGPRDPRDPGERVQSVPLSLRLAACCEIAMGVTMGYMLILML
jgi:hypothetical protein